MTRSLEISTEVWERLRGLTGRDDAGGEVCGLLVGPKTDGGCAVATSVVMLNNISEKKSRFAVDPDEYIKARDGVLREGMVACAFFHSHPSGSAEPSFRDLATPAILDLPSLIVANGGEGLELLCCREHRQPGSREAIMLKYRVDDDVPVDNGKIIIFADD